MSKLTGLQVATLVQQQARVQRYGDRARLLGCWVLESGEPIDPRDVEYLCTLGLFTRTPGGPGTYGHVDYHITAAGLSYQP